MGDFEHAGKFTTAQATKKLHALQFYFEPSADSPVPFEVKFMAFLTDFKDEYTTTVSTDVAVAREPIYQYQSTLRTLGVSWAVPAYGGADARTNLQKVSKLISMCYPVYKTVEGQATTMLTPPLVRIKFGNLITKLTDGGGVSTTDVKTYGLLGYLDGIAFAPNLNAGFYDPSPGELYPMQIDLQCKFLVIHENLMGWKQGTQGGVTMRTPNYPYGSKTIGDAESVIANSPPAQCPPGHVAAGQNADGTPICIPEAGPNDPDKAPNSPVNMVQGAAIGETLGSGAPAGGAPGPDTRPVPPSVTPTR